VEISEFVGGSSPGMARLGVSFESWFFPDVDEQKGDGSGIFAEVQAATTKAGTKF
jgi:hypothetical protein